MRDVNHSIVRPPETADPIADAHEIMRWAHDTYGDGLCLTASFGDATLVHLANVVVPGIEITLLDTGYLFAETEWFADDLRNRYGLNVRVMFPDADLAAYGAANDLPEHPLADRGYPSIGCWPCTRPVADGEDARAGRWAGTEKTECGLHL